MDIIEILRALIGLIFLFVVPGYALVWAFFPKVEDLTFDERIGLMFVLSIAADILVVLFIDLVLHLPTTPWNIFISIFTLTIIAGFIWIIESLIIKGKIKVPILRRKG